MQKISILNNLTEDELNQMKKCHCLLKKDYKKNEIIIPMNEVIHQLGIVLSGNVHIENIDFWGNKSILSNVSINQVFAETYAYTKTPTMVQVVAASDCTILFLDVDMIKNSNQSWSHKILTSMLNISVQKNLILTNRIFCTSPKTIRYRLYEYLSMQANKNKSTTFTIPFNRQQLADYLNVERTALSKELGKMQKDGILQYHKNQFTLYKKSISN